MTSTYGSMNPEIKEKWVAALRSGEYKQGRGTLKYTDRDDNAAYCCLGVLCEVAVKEGVLSSPTTPAMYGDWYYGAEEEQSALPVVVQDWAGLTGPGRLLTSVEGAHSLIGLNDELRLSFEQIADVIEEQF